MPQPFFITGEAGSGKTRKLMEQAALRGSELVTQPHQRALAIAVMHGARRRLQATLASHCPKLPVTVSTIHSFALTLVNRWRRSVGLSLPVAICDARCELAEKHWRTQATFDEVMEFACKILSSPTVRRTLGATYPLVLVDEFQDCAAGTLSFVQALADASTVLIAADHFQKLQDVSDGCPAVEWAQAMWTSGDLVYEELLGCQRTDNNAILRAARALRDNVKSETATIPLYYAPNVGPAACRMIGRFGWGADKITTGSCALIVLSLDDPLLTKLLQSFANQAAKRKLKRKVSWSLAVPESEHHKVLCAELGLNDSGLVWHPKTTTTSHLAAVVARDLTRFCRLRGREDIPQDLAQQFARLAVHNFRAFGWNSQRFQVLTVHGAKNREFDHVFVFWTAFKARKWSPEEQRRLLYNAVTRAKLDCTILVLGDSKLMQEDPVISLLGPAQPAIDPAWKKRKERPR